MPISFSSLSGGSSGGNGFILLVGESGNTTYTFNRSQPAGDYSITSQLNDSSFDVYLISEDNENVGYANSSLPLEATAEFNRIVVYGATPNDTLNFEYRASVSPINSGDMVDGAAPFLTSATPTTLESIDDTTTVTGGNFASDVEIVFTGQDAVDRPAKSIVRSSSTSLIVTRPDDFPVEQEPFTMTATNAGITNPTSGVNKLADYFDAGGGISWITGSSLTSAIQDVPYSFTLEATDDDSLQVSYSIVSGSLPQGLSLNTSTGEISGTPTTVESQLFRISAADSGGNSNEKDFSLSTLPSSISVEYLVVAGGGSSGTGGYDGGGGAGGYRSSVSGELSGGTASAEPALSVNLFQNYSVTVGAGGPPISNGSNSVFSSITSLGGGYGGRYFGGQLSPNSGGSGGGGNASSGGASGTANQGYSGGSGGAGHAGGGGGAASAGSGRGGNGAGRSSQITGSSVTRAAGGHGHYDTNGSAHPGFPSGNPNTGNGGGGGSSSSGGSGIVILRYPKEYSVTPSAGLVTSTSVIGNNKVTSVTGGTGTISWGA